MGELTAAVVHEVNQPVAGVVANTEAAMRWLDAQPPDIAEVRQALDGIVEDGKRTSEIVNRIRSLAKKAPPRPETLDINQIIGEVIALMRIQLQRADVLLQTRFGVEIAPVRGDRIQLQQVILNLILNAVDAMANVEGQRQLQITTEALTSKGVQVAVSDSGSGLGAGDPERIFEAFYTTKGSGMGMGLPICRRIVEAHGGRIWATHNDNDGATVHFTLL